MNLTDEQYKQVMRYVEGEMNSSEKKVVEAALLKNTALQEEVELYKEVQRLGSAIEQKISSPALQNYTPTSGEEDAIWALLSGARKEWEEKHELELKQKLGIATPEENLQQCKEQGKVVKTGRWAKLAVAAAFFSAMALGVVWYMQRTKIKQEAAINNKVNDVQAQSNQPTKTSETIANKQSAEPQKENARSQPDEKKQKNNKTEINAPERKAVEVNSKPLFATYFKPDAAPEGKEGPLQDAFTAYKNKQYQKTIEELDNMDLGPATRGEEEEQERLKFYTAYYKGLSYLAIDSVQKAIAELKKAESSDSYLQGKASWYLALAYLKAGQKDKALALLQQVEGNTGIKPYQQKVQQLLDQLKKP